MRQRGLPLVLTLLVVLGPGLAGCLDADVDPSSTVDPDGTAEPLREVLEEAHTVWVHGGVGSDATTFRTQVDAGDGTGAVFVNGSYQLADTEGSLVIEAEAPDGSTVELVNAEDGTDTFHAVLPAVEGTWTARGRVTTEGAGTLHASTVAEGPPVERVDPSGDGRTVVAVVDTGVNPYHAAFQRPDLRTEDLPRYIAEAGTGADPVALPLEPADDYVGSLQRDAGVWADAPAQQLVHFEGTNLLGVHLGETSLPTLPVLDTAGHGTSVAHAVTQRNPDVLVVMVTGGDYDEGVRWAADQPWIDLLSLSWGPAVNAAGVAEPYAFGFTTAEATHEVWDAGKLTFSATGNDPTHAVTDTTSGPPWVHSVSGSNPDAGGRSFMSGNGVDTVANWTQTLARYETLNETWTVSGTSFATPATAGIASRILHEAREAAGHDGPIEDGAYVRTDDVTVTNHDLRRALNATAVWWSTTDYGGPSGPGPAVPVAPGAPWVSMGWGHLDLRAVDPAVEGLVGDGELPDRPAEADAYMQAQMDARRAYWMVQGQG